MNRSNNFPRSAALRWTVLVLMLSLAACRTMPKREKAETPAASPTTTAPVVDKGDPESRFKAALDLMKTKKTAEAEAAFLKLAQDFPDYTGPQTNLGILYAKSNRRDIAIAALDKATRANPNNASAFNWMGVVYREAGDYPRAQKSYEKALQVKPDYAAAQLNLGLLFDEYLKQPVAAVPHYREYLRLYGKEDLRVLAWIAEIESAQKAAQAAAVETAAPVTNAKAKP